jgi:AAA domain
MLHVIGQEHQDLLTWLADDWLNQGPPVSFLQGFPGVGKTFVADRLVLQANRKSVMVNMPQANLGIVDDLLQDIATGLSENGHTDMADSITAGVDPITAFSRSLTQPILVVIDEFQNAFQKESNVLLEPVRKMLTRLTSAPQRRGRILILSSRLIPAERTFERCEVKTIDSLLPEEALSLLAKFFQDQGRNKEQEVPEERREDIVECLGYNPRAIRTFVAGLMGNSLEDLLGLRPELWEVKDREISPALVKE